MPRPAVRSSSASGPRSSCWIAIAASCTARWPPASRRSASPPTGASAARWPQPARSPTYPTPTPTHASIPTSTEAPVFGPAAFSPSLSTAFRISASACSSYLTNAAGPSARKTRSWPSRWVPRPAWPSSDKCCWTSMPRSCAWSASWTSRATSSSNYCRARTRPFPVTPSRAGTSRPTRPAGTAMTSSMPGATGSASFWPTPQATASPRPCAFRSFGPS